MQSRHKIHAEAVSLWMNGVTPGLSSEQLLELFDRATLTLWNRARTTISAVMLAAVFDRVIFNSGEKFPAVNSLKVSESGVEFDDLKKQSSASDSSTVSAMLEFVVTEFVSILGNLTNEVISSTLHSELVKIKLEPKLKVLSRTSGEPHE